MDRHLVAGKIMIHKEAETRVGDHVRHQCGAYPHSHAADHLTPGRLGIENAACRAAMTPGAAFAPAVSMDFISPLEIAANDIAVCSIACSAMILIAENDGAKRY